MAAGRFPVEAGHVLAFTRALGGADPADELPAVGDVAPSTFAIAAAQFDPEYPLRPRPGTPWHGSGGDAGLVTEGAGGLHAEQHFTYHRAVRVGDVLAGVAAGPAVGEARAFRAAAVPGADHRVPRRSGRARGDSPQRERAAGGIVTALRASELTVGQRFETIVVEDLKRTQIVQYAGASGDYNPLHTDEVYATKIAGYPSVFAHGMLTMGLTGQAVAGLVGAQSLLRFGVRFTAQVWPGDTLTVRSSVVRIEDSEDGPVAEFSVSTVAQSPVTGEDREVVSGYAHARLVR